MLQKPKEQQKRMFANVIPDANPPIFACGQAESNGTLTIIQALPDYAFAKTDSPKTRIAQNGTPNRESYTLLIPDTEEIAQEDGSIKIVDSSTPSKRQRQSVVSSGPEERLVTYHARVSYELSVLNEQNKPQKELRFRDELRSRLIGQDVELLIESRPIQATIDPTELKFHRLDAGQLTTQTAMQRFQHRIPTVIVTGKSPELPLYFRRLLHPNTIIIHDEQDLLASRMLYTK